MYLQCSHIQFLLRTLQLSSNRATRTAQYPDALYGRVKISQTNAA